RDFVWRFALARAAVYVDARAFRLQGAVRLQVALPNGRWVGQHADQGIGSLSRLGWCLENRTDPKLFRALPSTIPEPQIESLLMQAACHRCAHLPGAKDCDLHTGPRFQLRPCR